MKSYLITGFSLAAISAVVSSTAFADGGEGIWSRGNVSDANDYE